MAVSTLSKGYKLPGNPTTGDLWFPAMMTNIQLLNDHTHDGSDGNRIASSVVAVANSGWGSDLGGGSYRQIVTVPTGFTFDTCRIEVRRSTGEMVYPEIVKINASTFYLYTNNNSLAYNVSFI